MLHFHFTADHPGYVFVKNSSDAITETKIKLLKDMSWKPHKKFLPEQITAPGLSLKRKWYISVSENPRVLP